MALMISDKQIELKCIYYMVNGVGLLYKQISKHFQIINFWMKTIENMKNNNMMTFNFNAQYPTHWKFKFVQFHFVEFRSQGSDTSIHP